MKDVQHVGLIVRFKQFDWQYLLADQAKWWVCARHCHKMLACSFVTIRYDVAVCVNNQCEASGVGYLRRRIGTAVTAADKVLGSRAASGFDHRLFYNSVCLWMGVMSDLDKAA